jgi:hypothetical protein
MTGIGCIDYSIHITDNIYDDSPPWDKPTLRFPPPLNAQKDGHAQSVKCTEWAQPTRPISEYDMDRAIDAFCENGKEIAGFHVGKRRWGEMFNFPPRGQPQFYKHEDLRMHIAIGAATVNVGNPTPYDNMDYCK